MGTQAQPDPTWKPRSWPARDSAAGSSRTRAAATVPPGTFTSAGPAWGGGGGQQPRRNNDRRVMHTRGTPRRCTECAGVARRLLGLGICCPAVPAKPMAFFSHMGRAEPAPGRKTALELAAPSGGAGGAVALADVCPALTLTRAGAAVPGGVSSGPGCPCSPSPARAASSPAASTAQRPGHCPSCPPGCPCPGPVAGAAQ